MPPYRDYTPPSQAVKSPKKAAALPPFTDPPGWTSNPPSPTHYWEEWIGADSEGQIIARCYDLEPGQPVMEDNEGWHTIFKSGDSFYIWGRLGDEVEEFVERDIHEIVASIARNGLRELERRALP